MRLPKKRKRKEIPKYKGWIEKKKLKEMEKEQATKRKSKSAGIMEAKKGVVNCSRKLQEV